jgi:hypothetical protein
VKTLDFLARCALPARRRLNADTIFAGIIQLAQPFLDSRKTNSQANLRRWLWAFFLKPDRFAYGQRFLHRGRGEVARANGAHRINRARKTF